MTLGAKLFAASRTCKLKSPIVLTKSSSDFSRSNEKSTSGAGVIPDFSKILDARAYAY